MYLTYKYEIGIDATILKENKDRILFFFRKFVIASPRFVGKKNFKRNHVKELRIPTREEE